MSRHDNLDLPQSENGPSEPPLDDGRLQLDLRLSLAEVAAAEEEKLRAQPRRRPTDKELIRIARKIYEVRKERRDVFGDRLFGEPAWDMLLALYHFPSKGIFLGVTSLGCAAGIPATTGLRWQKLLQSEGLIERGPPVKDGRVQLVRLTEKGRSLMDTYLGRLYYCDCPAHGHEGSVPEQHRLK